MAHLLEDRIRAVRSRVRRLVVLHGLSAVFAAVLAVVIALGMGDYLIRFQDRGIRVICWLVVFGAAVWTCYRYLYLPMRARLRDVDLAVRLQERFPGLDDRLVSAVEFLRQPEDEPTAGSAALRRAVIAETTAETDRLDFADALDRGPPLRASMLAAAVGLVAVALAVLDPAGARIAVARLANPLGNATWPQRTHLLVRHADPRVARGRAFEIEVMEANQGVPLPAEVRIHYRFETADGSTTEELERMQLLAGAMVARRENVARSFAYRVEGGDDNSMPWTPVEVLEPAAVKAFTVEQSPPAYTGWPAKTDQNAVIRALVGTRLRFRGDATKPLASAMLCLEGGRQVEAKISEDGFHFSVSEIVVEKSGAYWFQLTDRDGLAGGSEDRYEIHAVPDAAPTVNIEQPAANLFVTPQAVVPLRIAAKDDLALRSIALVFGRTDVVKPEETTLPLYTGPEHFEPQDPGVLSGDAERGDRRVIEYTWKLEDLRLPPGAQLAFYAAAEDYRPQTGKSEPRRLSLITPEELQERIAGRQSAILAELVRVLKLQRDSRSQVRGLEIRLAEVGRLDGRDVDHLQAAELNQRQAGRALTSRSEGVPMHVLALLGDLQNNRVDSPDIGRHMQALLDEIDRLDREHLAAIGRELTAATKSAQVRLQEEPNSTVADAATAEPLTRAGKHQDQVIAALEAMLGELKQWDDYRRFHRDIAQLLRDQEDLARRAAELGRRTLTKELKDLLPPDVADLKILADRQLELARRLDRIEQEMEQAVPELRPSDPLAADTVADALDEARRLAITGAMRAAGGQLQENRMGQVAGQHKQIVQGLQEVLDILANRRQHELARLVRKLREVEADLSALEQQQDGLRRRMEELKKETDPARRQAELERLRREQQDLQQQAERMARRLERLQAQRAADALRKAVKRMDDAARAAGRGDAAGAAQQAAAAQKDFEEARRELVNRRLQVEVELALEQLARLEDALKHVHKQEQSVWEETRRIDSLQARGSLTRAQTASLLDLARLQQSLQAETAGLAEQMAGAGAFQLALSAAGRDMGRAAALLDRRQTGAATQQAEQAALARLALVLKALEPEAPEAKLGASPGGPGGPGQGKPPGGIQTLAELKLLKLMQEDVNTRTRQLQEAVGQREPTDEQKRQYAALGEEQGRLADLVLQLLRPAQGNPEDTPQRPEEETP